MDKKKVVAPLVCHGHSRPVVDLSYSPITPDGFFLISASKDSTPMLRNGETGDWIGTFEGHKGAVWSCCLDKHALRAASASADFSAKLWDALTGDVLHSFDHKHIVRACAFSEVPPALLLLKFLQDTNLLLTGGFEKILRIFDLNRPDAPPREIDSSPGSVRTVAWLHSDQTILSSSGDAGGLRLWDVRTGKVVQILETKFPVTSAEVSQDGRYITTADGSSVKFWDANHFGLVKSHELPCKVESASLEPKFGNRFIAGGEDMWVHVFDFHTGEEIGCNKGHHGPVHCLRFSPGGESYASGSEDGTIRIWQLGPLGQIEDNSTANGSTTANANDGMGEVTQKIDELAVSETKKKEETQVDGVEQKVFAYEIRLKLLRVLDILFWPVIVHIVLGFAIAFTNHVGVEELIRAEIVMDSSTSMCNLTEVFYFSSGNPRIEETRGVMHLFSNDVASHLPVERKPLLCVLCVPNHMTYSDFCQFCGSFVQHMLEMRIVRNDGMEDCYSILIRFDEQKAADTFHKHFSGRRFSSLEEETCDVLFAADVHYTGSIEHTQSLPASSTEQPFCPRDWTRIQVEFSQPFVIIPFIVHVFQNGQILHAPYKEAHATRHWKETQHCYALELETRRVWDYAGDNYVHRLIQSKTDGKLVELNHHGHHDSDGCCSCECGTDPGFSETILNSKVEAIVNEYNDLLTSQLEDQKMYFESLLQEAEEEIERETKEAVEKVLCQNPRLMKLKVRLDKCVEEKKFHDDINDNLTRNKEIWEAKILEIEEREKAALKMKDEEISELEEQPTWSVDASAKRSDKETLKSSVKGKQPGILHQY
uniref:Serine-threonine kinase receptor-associated protein n=1 Tax=Solanum lycopersicum TaxID=4081 RepID=A0A3Q7FUV3_SOLLC